MAATRDIQPAEARYRIVVGIDGSTDAEAALHWGMDHAASHEAAHVTLVHAWSLPEAGAMVGAEGFELGQAAAERLLADAEHAAQPANDAMVALRLEYAPPAVAILDNAEDANLIVVGTRGRGRVSGVLLGSVSRAVVTRAAVPVAVVGHTTPTTAGPIVVGVDDSPEARSALRWAVAYARRCAAPLKVIHAFQPQHLAGLFGVAKLQPDIAWRAVATRALARLIQAEVGEPDGLSLDTVAAQAGPAAGLLDTADGARLIVIGSRGRGGTRSVLLGSVSSEVLRQAQCPVVIVPPEDNRREHRQDAHLAVTA